MTTQTVRLCERRIVSSGISWRLYDHGQESPSLILLHGGGVDNAAISYGSAITEFGARRRVVAPDLPGFGDTEALSAPTVETYVDAVGQLVSDLGIESGDLAGLSLGGGIALGLALRQPKWLRRLVLIAPYGLTDRVPHRRVAEFMLHHPKLSAAASQLSIATPSVARRTLSSLIADKSRLSPELIEAVMAEGRRPDAGQAWQALQADEITPVGLRTCYLSRLQELTVPTLLLVGDRDKLVPSRDCEEAARRIPNASVRVLPRCSHWLPRDQPDQFVVAVQEFLRPPAPDATSRRS